MKPVVHLSAAVALLGRFPALAGIDLDVARGEIVLLRGPNGAGKTTLLRACAGLVPVVRGEAVVLGRDLRRHPRAIRRRVGLLGHVTGLHDDLTVGENVRFWGRAARTEPADVEAALALTGLDGRLRDVPVAELSAGQRRRTSLACLLARRPELWLLDEPHAGLDAGARDQLDALVVQAVGQGATVLMASHELDRAQALAHRVVDLVAGRTITPGATGAGADVGGADADRVDVEPADVGGADVGGADADRVDVEPADVGGADVSAAADRAPDLAGAPVPGAEPVPVPPVEPVPPAGRPGTEGAPSPASVATPDVEASPAAPGAEVSPVAAPGVEPSHVA